MQNFPFDENEESPSEEELDNLLPLTDEEHEALFTHISDTLRVRSFANLLLILYNQFFCQCFLLANWILAYKANQSTVEFFLSKKGLFNCGVPEFFWDGSNQWCKILEFQEKILKLQEIKDQKSH